ncbi:MAG: hypothetical protein LC808_34165, partial [Actinobacteria bacterium]|nr:hypothetical protein [Actinomycetota bacterium]
WWLEKYPTEEEIDLVRNVDCLYITHSHPDHFHWPSLRHLGPRATLHPRFPTYVVPDFLRENGYQADILEPWTWYAVGNSVKMASIPVPVDDSLLVIDTPNATVVNVNDANPRLPLLRCVRERMCTPGNPIVLLKSYSPASLAVSIYVDGERVPMKSKQDYAKVAQRLADALGASQFVPFASQAFFSRTDSRWANEYKVTYEDLEKHWNGHPTNLCKPFVTLDLEEMVSTSSYSAVSRTLHQDRLAKVVAREQEEASFVLPSDFDERLKKYLDEVYFLRLFFRRGIGWRLSTSGTGRFYNTRTRKVEDRIPADHDFVVTLPDKVLYEALQNNVLTDLGITMFTRVDTKVNVRLAYGAFSLMGLHDYGHFNDVKSFIRFWRFYLPYFFPVLLPARWRKKTGQPTPVSSRV